MNRCDEDKKWNCEFTLLMSPLKCLCSRPAVHICLWDPEWNHVCHQVWTDRLRVMWSADGCKQQVWESDGKTFRKLCSHSPAHFASFFLLIEVKMASDTSLFSCSSSLLNQFTLENNHLLQVNRLCSSSLIVLWLGAGPVCVNPSPSWSDLTAAQVKVAPDWLSNECILHLIGLKAFTNFTGYSFCRHGRESYKIRVKTLNCARAAFFKSDRLNVKWFDGSHREVKPKHLDGPLVAGCSIGHKPLLLHVSRWDMD